MVFISGGWGRIPPQEGGGAEAFILNVAKQLAKTGHEVILLDRKYSPSDSATEDINGVQVVRLESTRFKLFSFAINFVLSQVAFGFQVRKYLKNLNGSPVIHVYTVVLGLVLILCNKKIRDRVFYTSLGLRRDKAKPGIADRIAYILENILVRNSQKTTIANEITAGKLARQARVELEKVQVVPIGVDTEQYSPDLDTTEIQKKYDFNGKRNILFVGRICAEKGVEYLVKAANILITKHDVKNIQFILVGPAEQFGEAKNIASHYMTKILRLINDYKLQETINLTGVVPIDDLRKLYTACDIVVIPSVIDLDPQVQIEAMASGKPVIGTTVGTMPRRIRDGKSGFIIDPAREQQLAEKIKYFLDNPLEIKRMGDHARKNVCEKYSAEKMAANMLEVFTESGIPEN